MKLVLATGNRHKVREMKEILQDLREMEFISLDQFPQLPEVVESGSTLRENALQKARHAVLFTHCLTLAEDTGLEIDALGGKPGVRSSRFAGDQASYEQNIEKVLALMRRIPPKERGGRFRSVVAIVEPGGDSHIFEGVCEGLITTERRGKKGFGYDPIFEVAGFGRTFAQMDPPQKNRVSHRALALQKAKALLMELSQRQRSSSSKGLA